MGALSARVGSLVLAFAFACALLFGYGYFRFGAEYAVGVTTAAVKLKGARDLGVIGPLALYGLTFLMAGAIYRRARPGRPDGRSAGVPRGIQGETPWIDLGPNHEESALRLYPDGAVTIDNAVIPPGESLLPQKALGERFLISKQPGLAGTLTIELRDGSLALLFRFTSGSWQRMERRTTV